MGSRGRPRRDPAEAGRTPAPGARRHTEAPADGRTRAERRRLQRKVRRRRRRGAVREIPLFLGVAVLMALILKTFLVQAFVIPSGSMEQTIRIGDRVLVDKLTPWFGSQPRRGDVVVFRDPGGWLGGEGAPGGDDDPVVVRQIKQGLTFIGLLPSDDEQDLIKRVVGVGGDHVRCCDERGRITVNGVPLDEDYLYPGDAPSRTPFDVTVPEGRLWVMGDHRSNSADSRAHQGTDSGTVPVDGVVGRAVVVAWPFGHWRALGERDVFASVADAGAASTAAPAPSHRVAPYHRNALHRNATNRLPIPAELPLVMGVVGLHRVRGGRRQRVRSWRGGCGGWRTVRTRRRRGPRTPCARVRPGDGRRPGPGERPRDHRGRQCDGRTAQRTRRRRDTGEDPREETTPR
ncbi:signal peptidase I [Streptomyces sp. SHP 1-2]|uniref:signal peptidase I n=1 Tax=Streptomyces sp. SHP 1-2 TaxID=2769489 RepID=UPI002236F949|nr:signal peptidase I [Streptomyces sp. SHP 1-2]